MSRRFFDRFRLNSRDVDEHPSGRIPGPFDEWNSFAVVPFPDKELWQRFVAEENRRHRKLEEQRARTAHSPRSQFPELSRHQMLELSGSGFELYCAELLRRQGYRDVKRTGGSGDLQADLVATSPSGEFTVVQCKRYGPGNLVGSRDVQMLLGANAYIHKAAKMVFMTSSGFTGAALEVGRSVGMEMLDIDALIRLEVATGRLPESTQRAGDICPGCLAEFRTVGNFCTECRRRVDW